MLNTQDNALADIHFSLKWEKDDVFHEDAYLAHGVNFWQDYFPDCVKPTVYNKSEGYKTECRLLTGKPVPAYDEKLVKKIKISQLDMSRIKGPSDKPGVGRFYPKGIIGDIGGIYKQNITPFRFIGRNGVTAEVDFNHPMAGVDTDLEICVKNVRKNDRKFGGSSVDWVDQLITGPGMQARRDGLKTDFLSGDAFKRDDPQADGVFYSKDRLVSHIDETARNVLKAVYGKRLKNEAKVLDLMASWQSHLPDDLNLRHVDGLGMNKQELVANPRLSDYVIHDLNQNPVLPYPADHFDAVICSLSVEYLVRPFEVFEDVARVLKPGGLFVVTFSNRWFPPKAIEIWKHIHEFERMALVTDYFLETNRFKKIHTLSQRGYPRPYTDKYFPGLKDADPIYAVWGTCR